MKGIPNAIMKIRTFVIIATAALTVIFGYGLTKLTINSDIISYLKPRDPAVVLFNRIGEQYAGNLTIFTIVKSDDIFRRETLSFIEELTELYTSLDGVASVTSLANIIDIKGTDGGLEIGRLISPGDGTQPDLESPGGLREYVLDKDIYRGKVVSEDGSASIIISRINPRYNKIEVAESVKARTEAVKGNHAVQYSGYPIQMAELSRFLGEDLSRLIPIVIGVIILTLYGSFRTLRGVLLPLSIVLISTVWTLGIMGFLGIPLTIMSNIVPVVLLAIGTAYGIHLLAKYYEDIGTEQTKLADIRASLAAVGVPILLAGVTTIIGFLSFAGAYLTAVTEFGLFTALGVFFAMTLSLVFLPAVLSFMKAKKPAKRRGRGPSSVRVMARVGAFVAGRSRIIVIACAAAGLVSIAAIPRVRVSTQITTYFPRKSGIRTAEAAIKEEFGGSTPVQIVVKGDMKNPAVLKAMHRMQKFLGTVPHVNNAQSITDLVCRMNEVMNGRSTIPETREELANLLFMLEGEEVLEQLVKKDYG
jgi:uncharacterized protein